MPALPDACLMPSAACMSAVAAAACWLLRSAAAAARLPLLRATLHQPISALVPLASTPTALDCCLPAVQHTSASLTINENADPDVRVDMETFLNKVVPEGRGAPWIHTDEGERMRELCGHGWGEGWVGGMGWDEMGWDEAAQGGVGRAPWVHTVRVMGGWVAGRLRGFSTHSGMGGGLGRSGAGWLGVGGACSQQCEQRQVMPPAAAALVPPRWTCTGFKKLPPVAAAAAAAAQAATICPPTARHR